MDIIPHHLVPYFVILVLVILFYLLYKNIVLPVKGFTSTALIFLLTGVIDTNEMLAGFSNSSILTIIILILIAAGLNENYRIDRIFNKLLPVKKGYKYFLGAMMFISGILSSIANNTAVTALMTPYIYNWGITHKISPSKLLIPLSFSTILGGMITIIGTSTTLILNGFIISYGDPEGINIYHLFIIGLSVTLAGLGFMLISAKKLLPDNPDLIERFRKSSKEYLTEVHLKTGATIIGQTIKEAGLRSLKGLFLVEIIRETGKITPVKPEDIIQEGDLLIFAGNTPDIIDLIHPNSGLEVVSAPGFQEKQEVTEVVIHPGSGLAGKTIKQSDFRNRYDAAVIAVHRNGHKLSGKIGEVVINAGDTLLLFSGKEFKERVDIYKDLLIVSKPTTLALPQKNYKIISLTLLAAFLFTSHLFNLLTAVLILLIIMVLYNLVTIKTIKRELDLNMVAILVLALAIGKAIINSGAGELIAEGIIFLLEPLGPWAILIGILLFTTFLTSFVTNVAAVSVAFPVAYELGQAGIMDPGALYLAIAFAASAAFLTPISYQTNMMVYGPGGYKFNDFFKIGFPLTLIYLTVVYFYLILLY
ncbi:MAG: SLC13 family permease [Cyclobacteriaceae bacterium]|nr:SLC13 family permease [Cyclobacteriaceae bacterium]